MCIGGDIYWLLVAPDSTGYPGHNMNCDFCYGHRGEGWTCLECDGDGLAKCCECGTKEDIVHHPEGPEYICTDCLFEELVDDTNMGLYDT